MEIVGHEDDIVEERRHLGHGEWLQVPVSRREGRRHGLAASSKLLPHQCQECEVVVGVGAGIRRSGGGGRTGVFPVKVNSVQLVLVEERKHAAGKLFSIGGPHGITVSLESGGIG